ncbi:rcc01693 family protein [Devosia sp.]|uniref:rcc01693 family protein n=1 Tax=Devosia sp. TaxID=1871048 RepID=UPI003A8F5AB5
MRAAVQGFPWAAAMRFGFGTLRLSSRDFWALTPRELAAAMGTARPGAAPGRERFADLMQAFPDEVKHG